MRRARSTRAEYPSHSTARPLAGGVKNAIAAGDVEAARVAWEAMGRLIDAPVRLAK